MQWNDRAQRQFSCASLLVLLAVACTPAEDRRTVGTVSSCNPDEEEESSETEKPSAARMDADDTRVPGSIRFLTKDDPLEAFIPRGRIPVERCVVDGRRFLELDDKFERGRNENAEWYRRYRAEHEGLLPYDPRLGLTEEEYVELQRLLTGPKQYMAIHRTSMTFSRDETGIVTLHPQADLEHAA